MTMLVLGENDVRATLDMARCIDAMESVLAALARGDVSMPLRSIVPVPDESVLGFGLMPAHRAGAEPVISLKEVVVVPANKLVDFQELRPVLGLAQVRLATENELARTFPDCELGAMPPFGGLYGIQVYLDASLTGEPAIAFNAGTHREVIHMTMTEFRRLAQPVIVSLVKEPALTHW